MGLRLNKTKPNIYFKIRKTGGIAFSAMGALTHVNEKLVQMICHEYSEKERGGVQNLL